METLRAKKRSFQPRKDWAKPKPALLWFPKKTIPGQFSTKSKPCVLKNEVFSPARIPKGKPESQNKCLPNFQFIVDLKISIYFLPYFKLLFKRGLRPNYLKNFLKFRIGLRPKLACCVLTLSITPVRIGFRPILSLLGLYGFDFVENCPGMVSFGNQTRAGFPKGKLAGLFPKGKPCGAKNYVFQHARFWTSSNRLILKVFHYSTKVLSNIHSLKRSKRKMIE